MEEYLPDGTEMLFKEETDLNFGAWLNNPTDKFFLYSDGYKKAGKKLLEMCKEEPYFINSLVYPLIFNYRHFIELRLKELLILGYELNDMNKDFKDTHSITSLWNSYRQDILKTIQDVSPEIQLNIEKLLNQFQAKDPKSMNFRYPVTKGINREDSLNRTTIDLKNFEEVMNKIIYFFEWNFDILSNYTHLKHEMISEMYSNYY